MSGWRHSSCLGVIPHEDVALMAATSPRHANNVMRVDSQPAGVTEAIRRAWGRKIGPGIVRMGVTPPSPYEVARRELC